MAGSALGGRAVSTRWADPTGVLNFLARNLDTLLATYGYLAVFIFVGVLLVGVGRSQRHF